MELYQGENIIVESDLRFRVKESKATYYNQLRGGEYFDSREQENCKLLSYNDTDWEMPFYTQNLTGSLKKVDCQPIREIKRYSVKRVIKSEDGFIFDFGKNISGYTQILAQGKCGQEITLAHSEEINGNAIELNGLGCFYKQIPFQTDRIILSGNKVKWKPKFTYHGFRYVEVKGVDSAEDIKIIAIEVHQDIQRLTTFKCSDDTFNKIYDAGINSTYSNMFYMLTDCPTREKLGWLNDANASLDQVLTNFDSKRLLEKWSVDIFDSMDPLGNLPRIAPSPNWGYDYGAVCNACAFYLPLKIYKYTGEYGDPYLEEYKTLENFQYNIHKGNHELSKTDEGFDFIKNNI